MLGRRVSAALGAAVMLVVTACSFGGSTEAFCDQLDDGWREVEQLGEQAHGGPVAAFVAAFEGLGEFERLVDDLADVAPSEIADDMEQAAEVFSEMAEPVDDLSVSAVAGALMSNVDLALRNAGAFERVDGFAAEECGRQVFGMGSLTNDLQALASGGQPDDGDGAGEPAETVDERCVELEEVLEPAAPVSAHVAALQGAAEFELDGVADAADALETLDVDVGDGAGGWARLRWTDDVDPVGLLRQVNDAIEGACDRPVVDDEVIDRVSVMGPQPDDGSGPGQVGIYGPDEWSNRYHINDYLAGLVLFNTRRNSDRGVYHILDIDTGEVAEVFEVSRAGQSPPLLTGAGVAWIESEETESAGLEPSSRVWRLLHQTGPAEEPEEVAAWEDEDADETARLRAAWEGHMLVNFGHSAVVYDLDGRELDVLDDGVTSARSQLGPYIEVRNAGTYNLADAGWYDGPSFWLGTSGAQHDACLGARVSTSDMVSLTRDGGVRVVDLDGLIAATTGQTWAIGPAGNGVLWEGTGDEGLRLLPVGALDEPVWELPGEVVEYWRVFAGRLFVTTADDQIVEVDLDTGEEVDGPDDDIATYIKGQLPRGSSQFVDWFEGVVIDKVDTTGGFERSQFDACHRLDGR